MGLEYSVTEGIAVLALDFPPVNSLSLALRTELDKALFSALTDAQVKGIVIAGSPKAFSAGADLKQMGTPAGFAEPTIFSIQKLIESGTKPVCACIQGLALGGGLELALACDYRVAHEDAQLGMPEVLLGMMPGAGGTQRIPRLTGVATAAQLMVDGKPIRARKLSGTGLIDDCVSAEPLAAAIALLKERGFARRRVRDLAVNEPDAQAMLRFIRNQSARKIRENPAVTDVFSALEASLVLKFDEGLALERKLFAGLQQSPRSKAIRHLFNAERAVYDVPGLQGAVHRQIDKVAVIGSGLMGTGIAIACLSGGLEVRILDSNAEALARSVDKIKAHYDGLVSKGRLGADIAAASLQRVSTTVEYADLADADLIIEAVFEEMSVKESVFGALDAVAKPGAILATNTSRLDVNAIGAFTQRPRDVVGLHFFSPAQVMRLLEIVRGGATSADVMVSVQAFARRIKKLPVVSGVCDGFIGNRMVARYAEQANLLVEQGVAPSQIDRALENWGMAMGPFRMADLAGLDTLTKIRQKNYLKEPDMPRWDFADSLYEAGRFGQKNGRGWYVYPNGARVAKVDPEVTSMLESHWAKNGVQPNGVSDSEIVERCIFALINEGAKILEEGIALRASDIDAVYINGYGFPRQYGGPLYYADSVGIGHVNRSVQRFASMPGSGFRSPAALLRKMAEEGRSFNV